MLPNVEVKYEAPRLLRALGKALNLLRLGYSTNFAEFVVVDSKSSGSYRSGMVILASWFIGLLVLWLIVLTTLKIRGDTVGCASGNAFQSHTSYDLKYRSHGAGPIKVEEQEDSIAEFLHSIPNNDDSLNSSLPSFVDKDASVDYESETNTNDESTICSEVSLPSIRERRTRIVFCVLSCISLAIVSMIFVFVLAPFNKTTNDVGAYLSDAQEVLDQATVWASTAERAINGTVVFTQTIPTSVDLLCPLSSEQELRTKLGVDIGGMLNLFGGEYVVLQETIKGSLYDIDRVLFGIEESINFLEVVSDGARAFFWVVPTLLFGVSTLIAFALFGVVLSWKKESNFRFQLFLSYGVLPMFIFSSCCCWIVAVISALVAAMGNDACTQGEASGYPGQTIHHIMQAKGVEQGGLVGAFVAAITQGCDASDPSSILLGLEANIQVAVDITWRHLSSVDAAGRFNLVEMCGGEKIEQLLVDTRDTARLMTLIRTAFHSMSSSLGCSRVQPIYHEAIHDSMCTTGMAASSWAFVLFLSVGVVTMAMVSIRASWIQNIQEGKIYHEDEVAENMMLDEHEEYLAYISRYKHEWQEYEGIDTSIQGQRQS